MIAKTSRQDYVNYRDQIRQRATTKPDLTSPHHSGGHNSGSAEAKRERSRNFRQLFFAFIGLLRGHRARIGVALATLTVSTILGLLPPAGTKLAIDYVLTTPVRPLPAALQRWPWLENRFQLLIAIAVAVTAITLFRTLVHLWGRWNATLAVNQVQVGIRRRVFRHLTHLPLFRIQQLKSGGATSVLREDAGGVADLIFSLLYNPWQAIIQLLGSLVVLIWVDWRLMLGGLALLPIVYYSHRTWIYRIRPLYKDIRSQRQRVDGSTTETFSGVRIMRTFARERTETGRYVRGNHLLVRQQLFVWWSTRLIEVVWEVLIPLASTGLLVYGGWQILQGQLTLGDLMMFLVYLTMLLGPIATIAGSAVQLQNGLAGLDRILDLLAEPQEMPDSPDSQAVHRERAAGALSLNGVSFKYPASEGWVLRDIDLEIAAGQTVALVGRSGAGKTTLCNLIARFYDATDGTILLDGHPLRDIQLNSFRRLLGIVEQDVFLFDGSIAENIAYGRRGAELNEIIEAAQAAAADEFIRQLPQGYDTIIGERGVRLSGGQRQRLAIARAFLADPRILILDEATSNLDSESERLIQQSLARLLQNRTSVVISHRLSTVMKADMIVVIEDGRIVDRGTHAELLANSPRYLRMVQLQTDQQLLAEDPV